MAQHEKWQYKVLYTHMIKCEPHLQRTYDATHTQKILADFEEGLVNPILISAREENNTITYVSINGQHTRAVLASKGIKTVMCRVGYGLTPERERELFVKVDTYFKRRGKVEQTEKEIGVPNTIGDNLNNLLEKHGYDWKSVNCIGSLRDIFKKEGQESFDKGLKLYSNLFTQDEAIHKNVFGGFLEFARDNTAYDLEKMRRVLSALAGRISTPKEIAANVTARYGKASYSLVKKYLESVYFKRKGKSGV
jgi:hypothetical protein